MANANIPANIGIENLDLQRVAGSENISTSAAVSEQHREKLVRENDDLIN